LAEERALCRDFVSQFLCGWATVTSASRMIFAFAREGGLPGWSFLRRVSPRYRTPNVAIWTAWSSPWRSSGAFSGDDRRLDSLFDFGPLGFHGPPRLNPSLGPSCCDQNGLVQQLATSSLSGL
jgi:hypothetical protein